MKTYEEIGQEAKLDPETFRRFVTYMRLRWSDPKDEDIKCQVGYAREWADRFKNKMEYPASDQTGQAVLKDIDNIRKE